MKHIPSYSPGIVCKPLSLSVEWCAYLAIVDPSGIQQPIETVNFCNISNNYRWEIIISSTNFFGSGHNHRPDELAGLFLCSTESTAATLMRESCRQVACCLRTRYPVEESSCRKQRRVTGKALQEKVRMATNRFSSALFQVLDLTNFKYIIDFTRLRFSPALGSSTLPPSAQELGEKLIRAINPQTGPLIYRSDLLGW